MEINYFILGIIGVLAHSLNKGKTLSDRAKSLNEKFSLKDYLNKDWLGISLSLLAVVGWVFLFDETAKKYPVLQDFVQWSFFLMGFFGSYILQTLLSRGNKIIDKYADEKSNIADDKVKSN